MQDNPDVYCRLLQIGFFLFPSHKIIVTPVSVNVSLVGPEIQPLPSICNTVHITLTVNFLHLPLQRSSG
jgi:hypothetical protein